MKLRIGATIANEWESRSIGGVIPALDGLTIRTGTLEVSADVAREILADCKFNGDARNGPEYMDAGVRRAYRALAAQIARKQNPAP
jgi:hypothetical protein